MHSEKSKRNSQIRKLLINGISQAEVAREFNIIPQRLGQLVQKWQWQGLLERNEQGFAMPAKGRTPAKVIHNQKSIDREVRGMRSRIADIVKNRIGEIRMRAFGLYLVAGFLLSGWSG